MWVAGRQARSRKKVQELAGRRSSSYCGYLRAMPHALVAPVCSILRPKEQASVLDGNSGNPSLPR